MERFPNRAGDLPGNDECLRVELEYADIPVLELEVFRGIPQEVVSAVRGELHGWFFERAWQYWRARGPGLELAAAEALHATHGATVRVDGDVASNPRERFLGLACGSYHIDDLEGLKALAATIRMLVARAATPIETPAPMLADVAAALNRFIHAEAANGAADGLACALAKSLKAEAEEGGPTCFKGLPPLKQALLDYVMLEFEA